MIDNSRLASVIFDGGKKISQSRYIAICESIESDSLSLDEYVISYKKRDDILGNLFFCLKDGSRVLLDEECVSILKSLDMDQEKLTAYMNESYDNFFRIIKEIVKAKDQKE